ncbi:MAG: PEP-CTERM sorting domain-containing protein [Sphingomonadales bacterium]|nr:PEP-CTERM sorting domain-containing protein [Sphingomonadales bacterium]
MEESAKSTHSRYRATRVLLLLGVVAIGFTRLEDRAIIGIPGPAANAMAAMAIPPSDESDDGSYADEPDGVVRVTNANRIPRNRIRRALRDRDFGTIAQRDPAAIAPAAAVAATVGDPAAAAVTEAFATPADVAPVLALAGPALGPAANRVFSAGTPPATGSSSGGGSTGGGTDGGSTGGSSGGTPENPVSAVPEPATWLSLMLGLFAIGATMRRRHDKRTVRSASIA